jgi:NADH-quinone oxidoreductase subunit C
MPILKVNKDKIKSITSFLHRHPELYFDMLSCITGIDNYPTKNTFEVVYNLYSITKNIKLALKVELDRVNPKVESVCEIWKCADWLERETYDMYGIIFENHPDLRRILLPADWEGYPLRKDYVTQEYYHNVKVAY